MEKQTSQYKKFFVLEAHYIRSFTPGLIAIDAELRVKGEFGEVFLSYNGFDGDTYCASKKSALEALEEPGDIEIIEEWEGGLDSCSSSKFYLGFKALSDFVDSMLKLS